MRHIGWFISFGAILMSACTTAPTLKISEPIASDHPLAFMFGEWVGEASGVGPDRQPFTVTQTERVGPMLDGDVVLVEGAGYTDDGNRAFNALGIISCTDELTCEIQTYSDGRSGTFPFSLTGSGYVWSVPTGPSAQMRYTAIIKGENWDQVGEFIRADQPPVQTFKMSLVRKGSTDWPRGREVVWAD